MQMTTPGWISAFKGLRASWGWWRKNEADAEETEHERRMRDGREGRELAFVHAQTVSEVAAIQVKAEREVAAFRAKTERAVAEVRAQGREQRLQSVMVVYASI